MCGPGPLCVHCKSILGQLALERDLGWVMRRALGSTQFGRRGICLSLNSSSSKLIFHLSFYLIPFIYPFIQKMH